MLRIIIFLYSLLLLSACGGDSETAAPTQAPAKGSITTKFTVVNIPATLPVNQSTTPDNTFEYYWVVEFDINNNKKMDAGDVGIHLTHFKSTGSITENKSVIEMNVFVYEFTAENRSLQHAVTGEVSVENNTVTLTIPKSAHSSLVQITTDDWVWFASRMYAPNATLYGDSYPVENSQKTYMPIPLDGMFTDDISDLTALLGQDLRVIDLQTMELIITN